MGSCITNIHFDYEGHYSKSGDDSEWMPNDGRLFTISLKTSSFEEITYSLLKDRICRKMGIDPLGKRLNLSYIPLVVEPRREAYILDDEDVFVYLTSVDKEKRRSILHVEEIKELEIVPITEQLSRAGKGSSHCGNYSEHESEVEGNPGAVTQVTPLQEAERFLEVVERVVNVEAEEVGTGLDDTEMVEKVVNVEAEIENVGRGLDDTVMVENENNADNHVASGANCSYVDLPRPSGKTAAVTEWEDGMGIEMFQEFSSKDAVKDIIDAASQQNTFGIIILNSDKSRYVVKCRGAAEGCKWFVRATKIRNSSAFLIRTYIKMHSSSQTTSST